MLAHDPRVCPHHGEQHLREEPGRLEQSGRTYLPTTVTRCLAPNCEWARWAPAPADRVTWRSEVEPPAEPAAPRISQAEMTVLLERGAASAAELVPALRSVFGPEVA